MQALLIIWKGNDLLHPNLVGFRMGRATELATLVVLNLIKALDITDQRELSPE